VEDLRVEPPSVKDRIWTPPHIASISIFGAQVRLLTYIRPRCDPDQPRSGHDGLFARRSLIALSGSSPLDIPRVIQRRFDLFAIDRMLATAVIAFLGPRLVAQAATCAGS
jgi:hypothetical protein